MNGITPTEALVRADRIRLETLAEGDRIFTERFAGKLDSGRAIEMLYDACCLMAFWRVLREVRW